MPRVRSSLIVAVAIIVVGALHPMPAQADTWDQLTYLTFSAPVEIPGAVLPAGTYTFKLADPDASRDVVRVLSRDGSQVYATFFTIPDDRLTPTDQPTVTFAETPAGTPEAIKAWFYAGDRIGHEFVYPEDQAQKIATATHQPVLASASVQANQHPAPADTMKPVEPAKAAPVGRVNGHGETQPMHSETSARTAPMKSLQAANVSAAPAAATATTGFTNSTRANRSARRLPKTASTLPLFALISVASFVLGLGTHALRKRLA